MGLPRRRDIREGQQVVIGCHDCSGAYYATAGVVESIVPLKDERSKFYTVPVRWALEATAAIEASSKEEAVGLATGMRIGADGFPTPSRRSRVDDADYIPDSFEVDRDNVKEANQHDDIDGVEVRLTDGAIGRVKSIR